MKLFTALFLSCIFSAALIPCCTTPQSVIPPATNPAPAPSTPASESMVSPAMPEDLTGNWTLTEMRTRGGAAIVTPTSVISLRFSGDGTLSGYDECNNYFAAVTLTGGTTPDGSGITLGSVGSTKKYCAALADQEQQYLNILAKTSAYAIDATRLTLTTTTRDVLIFRR